MFTLGCMQVDVRSLPNKNMQLHHQSKITWCWVLKNARMQCLLLHPCNITPETALTPIPVATGLSDPNCGNLQT